MPATTKKPVEKKTPKAAAQTAPPAPLVPQFEERLVDAGVSQRLARLFAACGLIHEADWDRYQKGARKHKNLLDVLNQSAFSFSTYSDLLFKAEINPFRRDEESALGAQLSDPIELEAEELAAMLSAFKPDADELVHWLTLAGVDEAEAVATGVAQASNIKEDVHQWLVSHGLLTASVVRRFTSAHRNRLAELNALWLALGALRVNGVITPADAQRIGRHFSGRHSEGPDPAALKHEVREAVKISSRELLDKIFEGMSLPAIAPDQLETSEPLMKLFPESLIRRMGFIPLSMDETTLRLATPDPLNLPLLTFLRWATGRWPQAFFAPTELVQERARAYYDRREAASAPRPIPKANGNGRPAGAGNGNGEAATPRPAAQAEPPARAKTETRAGANAPVDSLSAVQLVSSIIESAIELKATDIHLEPRRDTMIVRMRIDGVLTRLLNIPANLTAPVTSRIKVLARMDVTERRRPQDGHLTLDLEDRRFDFRIATLPTFYGEKIAVRILDSARVMTGLSELGMNAAQLEVAARLIRQPYGMILVTGPTGSGKTSTLYAALHELNREDRHLVTIEDPIEYQLDGINQVQTDAAIGLSFSDGLRAVLRQDPNVIMVGEIRDPDTAKTAIRAALTGHLVFSTLHTNTAAGAFQALANLGATPYMIGSSLTGVIAQRLLRKLCPACKKSRAAAKPLIEQLGLPASVRKLFRAEGCQECLGSGYQGRTGCFEIIEMTEKLRRQVLNDDSPDALLQTARAEGRIAIREAGLEKVLAGVTSPEEVLEKVFLDA